MLTIGKRQNGKPFTLDVDVMTDSVGIIARKGAGKTYLAAVVVEEVLAAGQQVVVVDPCGVLWGLQSSKDGKRGGFPIVVLGGEHQNLPLGPGDGKLIADLVVDNNLSVVLDLVEMEPAEQRTFVAAFSDRLYQRKGREEHRTPLMVMLDEADQFVPQNMKGKGEIGRCFNAVNRLVRLGRSRGIGVWLISQRPAVVNKDCLTQIANMFCLCTTGPQDRNALREWVIARADTEQGRSFMDTIHRLKRGQAWWWAPDSGVLERVDIRVRSTFDSSFTPKVGQRRKSPKKLADIDLTALKSKLSATIKVAKANDPKELNLTIQDLRQELKERPEPKVDQEAIDKAIEQAVDGALDPIRQQLGGVVAECGVAIDLLGDVLERFGKVAEGAGKLAEVKPGRIAVPVPRSIPPVLRSLERARASNNPGYNMPPKARHADNGESLPIAHRKILTVLAQFRGGRTKSQLAILTGYSVTSGGFGGALAALRAQGRINGLVITHDGAQALGPVDPLPTGARLLDYWVRKLKKAEGVILNILHSQGEMTKEELAESTGYSVTSGGFGGALATLRTLELITRGSPMRISDVFSED